MHRLGASLLLLLCSCGTTSDSTVRIRVVDGDGRPRAGIPVAVSARDRLYWPLMGSAETGPEGVARVVLRRDEATHREEAFAFIDLPLIDTKWRRFSLQVQSEETIELVEPPTGSVVLEAIGPKGESFEELARFCLQRALFRDRSSPFPYRESYGFMTWRIDYDGSFRVHDFPPGMFDLTIHAEDQVIAEIRGIEVHPGETTRDPRVNPLDLRGNLP